MNHKKHFFIWVALFIVGFMIGYFANSSGVSKGKIKWKFGDSELEIDIKEDMIDSETFLEKLFSKQFSKDGATGWLKNNMNLYEVDDIDLADKIALLDENKPISVMLRNISQQRKGPWTYQVDTVFIGVPEVKDQPKDGYANVCESGIYIGQKIKIYDLYQYKSIVVFATGRYACPEGVKYPDLQLSAKDAKYLFGTKKFLKYQKAIVLIVSE